jgi:HPt (histidine-containing phosphotransfer) domain-containing protein
MDDYLTKPINREELFATLIKAVVTNIKPIAPQDASDSEVIDLDEPLIAKQRDVCCGIKSDPVRVQDTDILSVPEFKSSVKQETPGSSSSVIDQTALWQRLEGDSELLRELLDGYRDFCPTVLAELRHAVETRNAGLVQQSAHQIKGVIANFAASEAYSSARDLERSGRNADLTRAPDMLARLEAALVAVDRELEEMSVLTDA